MCCIVLNSLKHFLWNSSLRHENYTLNLSTIGHLKITARYWESWWGGWSHAAVEPDMLFRSRKCAIQQLRPRLRSMRSWCGPSPQLPKWAVLPLQVISREVWQGQFSTCNCHKLWIGGLWCLFELQSPRLRAGLLGMLPGHLPWALCHGPCACFNSVFAILKFFTGLLFCVCVFCLLFKQWPAGSSTWGSWIMELTLPGIYILHSD